MNQVSNSWPGGNRHAMTQSEHEKWNSYNYPGTLQLCSQCDEPTGSCEEDTIYDDESNPICKECEKAFRELTEELKQ